MCGYGRYSLMAIVLQRECRMQNDRHQAITAVATHLAERMGSRIVERRTLFVSTLDSGPEPPRGFETNFGTFHTGLMFCA